MKTKLRVFLTLVLVLLMQVAFAQDQTKTITGTVSDNNGMPLPGVNITIQGTTQGTVTNFNGEYTIEVSQGDVLKFSIVGFEDYTVTVGNQSVIDVTLKQGTTLDKVVITALGISREKRSLGYATQEVEGDKISEGSPTNFINSLSGRVSGLNITRNNNFGGSTDVIIRGSSSITGNNQALFVIDGVPISNRNTNTKGQRTARGTNYDYGNAATDINPEDIASINVLKGAAATALYGSRAANGVIIITTKKGKEVPGLGVTINSGVEVGFIDKSTWPTYQDQYGAGYEGQKFRFEDIDGDGVDDKVSNYIDDASYGPAFDPNLKIYQWDAFDPASPNYMQKTPWVAAENGPIEFFETPVTLSNSVSVSDGYEKGAFRISYTKKDQTGLMPNSHLHRNDFKFSGNFDLSDKLHVSGFANYIKTKTKGRNSTGYNDNIVTMFRQWWETNVDVEKLRKMYEKTGRNVSWNPGSSVPRATPLFWDNPYWTRYENYQNDWRSRFIGKIQLSYDVTDWFNIMGRVSTDTYTALQEERRAVGSVPADFGVTRGTVGSGYLRRDISFYETNYDLMLNFDTDITDDLNFAGLLGTNIRRSEFNEIFASTAGGLRIPGLYSLQNSVNAIPNPIERLEKIGVDGIYASASFGYDNMLYLDGTIRRDHVSTLPEDNSVFYYPSVSASWLFSQVLNSEVIDFGKFRINYAEVGNGAPFDKLYDTYVIRNDIGTNVPGTHNNPNLKPERTKSFEVGLNMRFLDSRLGIDVAYYNSKSINQIIETPISTATGYFRKLLNAGKMQNTGVEITLNATPIKTEDFSWNLTANFSKNENKVLELPEGINTIQLGSFQGGVTIEASEGQPIGVIRGTDYVYDDNGNRLINGVSDPDAPGYGMYQITRSSNNIIGNVNPDWLMGISNSFSYKNLTFSFLIDIQQGGSVFSLDQYYGEATGLYPNSTFINDLGNPVRLPRDQGGGFINPGVLPDGSQNDHRVDASEFGQFGYSAYPNSEFVYDASYVKLRQVSLTYTLPKKLLENTFLTDVQFSLTGSNLWIIHKNIPYADPEAGLSSGNLQGYIAGAMPTTKRYGFNVRLQF